LIKRLSPVRRIEDEKCLQFKWIKVECWYFQPNKFFEKWNVYYQINQRRNEYNPRLALFMYYNPKNFKGKDNTEKNKRSFQAQKFFQIKFFHQIWYWISF